MIIDQGELFQGTSHIFVKRFIEQTVKESYNKGDFLFHEKDEARYFYTLIEGRVKLSIGNKVHEVHIVSHAGEAFGWSSLVGSDCYTASAECIEPTTLFKVDGKDIQKMLEENSSTGFIFFRNLSKILGKRLLRSYSIITCS